MSTSHQTRCPWIQQSDADTLDHIPFLCGPAAAQMILYGRTDAKFSGDDLVDSDAQLRSDQLKIWKAIKKTSKTMALPTGATYDGRPQQEQVRDAPAHAWATFPDVLSKMLSDGVTVDSGTIQGVATKVRKFDDDVDIEPAIIDSLDRGVAAALLVDGTHWVVVHRYVQHDDETIEIYYRDGLHPKLGSETPWDEGDFTSEVTMAPGIYSGKYVAVTASSSLPRLANGNRRRLVARSARRAAKRAVKPAHENGRAIDPDLTTSKVQPFPDALGPDLAARLGRDPEWAVAFGGVLQRFVLKVTGTRPGSDYYLVDYNGFAAAASAATGVAVKDAPKGPARSGSVIVDAYTLKPRVTAGIDKPGQHMPPLLAPQDLPAALERLGYHVETPASPHGGNGGPTVRVADTLIWTRCDQSMSPFLPFYQIYQTDPQTHAQKKLYLRADGRLFDRLTQRMSGI